MNDGEFRAARERAVSAPDGWLSVTALHWLTEGEQAFPVGTVRVTGSAAWLRAADGTERRLRPDDEPGPPDRVPEGRRTWELLRRDGTLALRVRDPEAPARRAFRGLDWYPPDPAWRALGILRPHAHTLGLERMIGGIQHAASPGVVELTLGGRQVALEPMLEGQSWMFVFADETNRDSTYPAGRFLFVRPPDGERVVLDFNRALNPPCAFTPWATCPLPPPGNRLALRIEAGERRYTGLVGDEPGIGHPRRRLRVTRDNEE